MATWQGENRFDSDLDGFPDTLHDLEHGAGRSALCAGASARRPTPRGVCRCWGSWTASASSYDLTTDVALAGREGPSLSNAPGVAIAGTETWVPRQLRDGLRREVEDGGLRVVSFGDRSLRRTVALVKGRLRDPSPARPDDLFGERTEPFRTDEPAPLAPAA
ncbi:MAG: hypothetical protein WKF40_05325 [Thermoleophilaceae bacterium]